MRRLPPLAALRAFEAAARHLSFKRAAAELGVTPTAISHQVRLLEAVIAQPVFVRQVRRVSLTAAGQALFPVLRDGLDAMAKAIEGLARHQPRATVTISATVAFTAKWLVPRIAGFRALRPDIDLKLLATDEVVALEPGVVDLAVRYGRGPYSGAVAAPVIADRFAPVASPRLGLRHPRDLRTATMLHFTWRRSDARTPTWPRWLAAAGLRGIDGEAGLRFSEESHAIQAAVAGLGVALLSRTLIADELAGGTLAVPFGPHIAGPSLHLLQAREPRPEEPMTAARDWLVAELRAATRDPTGRARAPRASGSR